MSIGSSLAGARASTKPSQAKQLSRRWPSDRQCGSPPRCMSRSLSIRFDCATLEARFESVAIVAGQTCAASVEREQGQAASHLIIYGTHCRYEFVTICEKRKSKRARRARQTTNDFVDLFKILTLLIVDARQSLAIERHH